MRKLAVGAVIGVIAWAVALLLSRVGLFEDLERASYDRRVVTMADSASASDNIVIVEINESTLAALEPVYGRWPWPRVVHAGAIDFLSRAGATVIAYDILFLDHDRRGTFAIGSREMSGAESDQALADSIGRAGNVLLAASGLYEGLASGADAPSLAPPLPGTTFAPGAGFATRPYLQLPLEPFANASAGVGHTVLEVDEDGPARRVFPFVEAQGRMVPWLGMAAALHVLGAGPDDVARDGQTLRVGERQLALDGPQMIVNFAGPFAADAQSPTYPVVSFYDVLRAEEAHHAGEASPLDPALFKNKLVLVGLSALTENDVFPSPFEGAAMPGVHIHASSADNVLSANPMRRANWWEDSLLGVPVTLAAGVATAVLPLTAGVLVAVALGVTVSAGVTWAVGQGVWLAAVTPVLGMALATFGGTAWQYFVEGRQKRQLKTLFGRYVSPDVFAHLVANPQVATLGGQRRQMSVLFSDVRGFTAATEQAPPEAVVAQLNEYFTAMVQVLFRHHGTLDKFVGDMVMGLFGAPVADPSHADHAVAAAVDMVQTLDRLNRDWKARGLPTMEIGIGVNSGEMIAGNIGSDTVMSYTVIGDAVNLGARLESLNKELGTRILISEATRSLLSAPPALREVGMVTVKGKQQPVLVHAVETEKV